MPCCSSLACDRRDSESCLVSPCVDGVPTVARVELAGRRRGRAHVVIPGFPCAQAFWYTKSCQQLTRFRGLLGRELCQCAPAFLLTCVPASLTLIRVFTWSIRLVDRSAVPIAHCRAEVPPRLGVRCLGWVINGLRAPGGCLASQLSPLTAAYVFVA